MQACCEAVDASETSQGGAGAALSTLEIRNLGAYASYNPFQSILKTLMTEITGSLGDKLSSMAMSVAFAQADASELDEAHTGLVHRAITHADMPDADMMLEVRGKRTPG
jgi:hypothetical protein